ncbi:IS481 family transposase [Cupriavidus pauculus]|uniref:IS481 family transposase n=1 Tax=Cupriavidus pauculus TaxID=82633 RepID=UPI001EE39BA5|nr:IS481 family transposase [Cupriavidus pauculus]GJG98878.1 IS481 family transposase [Cupriavidus pauculus]
MPWKEVSLMDQRVELMALASHPEANRRELARRYGISAKTLYKWLQRYEDRGAAGLFDQPRRPGSHPLHTASEVEQQVLALRDAHPYWGARKLARLLQNAGLPRVPAASTIHEILRRHGRLGDGAAAQPPFQRFEHPEPNDLWQMDFKGYVRNVRGLCHPLTVLDDHSRFSLCLAACDDQRGDTVQPWLIATFRRYGLPRRMTMDNGPPWGGDADGLGYTALTVWLMQLGIAVSHSRPYHPQTQGKDERFHRTLKVELLQHRCFADNAHAQRDFDRYRQRYNGQRPHEALGMAVPLQRYRSSAITYPERLPEVEYLSSDRVYKVGRNARIDVQGRRVRIGKAFIGRRIALRPKAEDGCFAVWFSRFEIGEIDLRAP